MSQYNFNFEAAPGDDHDFLAEPRNKLEKDFARFHYENPEVYELCERFIQQAVDRGFKNFGIGFISERIRWETNPRIADGEPFKINNNHRAYYARLIEQRHPEWRGIFRSRRVRSEKEA